MLIAVIDDELQIRRLLRITLEANGHKVLDAATGETGLRLIAAERPDAVILDLALPDMDGLELLGRLREWSTVPVVVLSARTSEKEKIALLDAGADDYLTKPFSTGELMARLRTAQRHATHLPTQTIVDIGPLRVDLTQRLVFRHGEQVKLTSTEYALLRLFVQNAGRVLTHPQLLRDVWGAAYQSETQYLRVYVASLRKKLEDDPANPRLIITEPGIGYRLNAEA